MPKLIIKTPSQEWVAELVQGTNVLGRSTQCTVPIREPSLSRQHCEVVLEGAKAKVVDKGSMNGTLLNGKRVWEQELKAGDRITIGGIHIWYEAKGNMPRKAQTQAPTPMQPLPAQREAPPTPAGASSGVATRRVPPQPVSAPTTDTTHSPAAPETSDALEAAEAQLGDYTYRGPAGGPWGKIFLALVILAVIGAGVYFGKDLFKGGTTKAVDAGNLIRFDPTFDQASGGAPSGWKVVAGKGVKATTAVDQGIENSGCVVLERTRGAVGLEAVLGYGQEIPLGRGGQVNAEVSTRFEGFSGQAGIRIQWLRRRRDIVLSEEYSDFVSDAATWIPMNVSFTPPPGAGAFRIGLAALGASGRVLFDNVRVTVGPGSRPEAPRAVGEHRVSASPQGVLQISVGANRTISNVQIALESEADGSVAQTLALDVETSPKDDSIVVTGRLPDPSGQAEIEFEESVSAVKGGSAVVYHFPGDGLRAIDRVTVAFTLPLIDGVLGLPEGDTPVTELTCASTEGDFIIDYLGEVRVRTVTTARRTRLYQTFAVERGGEDLEFGFRIRNAKDRDKKPSELGRDHIRDRKYGSAIEAFRESIKQAKTEAERGRYQKEIDRLVSSEEDDWRKVVSSHIVWGLSGSYEAETTAREAMERYGEYWDTSAYRGKAADLLKRTQDQLKNSPSPERERPGRVFARAQAAASAGQRAMAAGLLRALIERWPEAEIIPEAQRMLQSLGQ